MSRGAPWKSWAAGIRLKASGAALKVQRIDPQKATNAAGRTGTGCLGLLRMSVRARHLDGWVLHSVHLGLFVEGHPLLYVGPLPGGTSEAGCTRP